MGKKQIFTLLLIICILMLSVNIVLAFSDEYEPYYPMITASTQTAEEIYDKVSPTEWQLNDTQKQTRLDVIRMYQKAGFDVSWGMDAIRSTSGRLKADIPQRWSKKTPGELSGNYENLFSVDACFNNKIPIDAPKVLLSRESFVWQGIMIGIVGTRANPGGNGTGTARLIGKETDPLQTIVSQWQNQYIDGIWQAHIPSDALQHVNYNTSSDQHVIYIDTTSNLAAHTYKTIPPNDLRGYNISTALLPGYDFRAQALSNVFDLTGIGSEGRTGVNAVEVPQEGYTIKSGEMKDPTIKIEHAIGMAVGPMMYGRVYPALTTDGASFNGKPNFGAVPYGGIVWLDTELDLESLLNNGKISMPAYKILKAMQEYGAYNIDMTGSNAVGGPMIYTSTFASDWMSTGDNRYNVPIMGGVQGSEAVEDELSAFFNNNKFFGMKEEPKVYCTIPNVKYANLDCDGNGSIDENDKLLIGANLDKPVTESNKLCDVNLDGAITGRDAEIMYNYFNDLPSHTFEYVSITNDKDNNSTNGRIVITGTKETVDSTTQLKKDEWAVIAALPYQGYEFDGWLGDFADYPTSVVTIKPTMDLVIGVKYRPVERCKVKINIVGNGKVEATTNDRQWVDVSDSYGINTLVNFRAVADENSTFLRWEGDASAVSTSISKVINNDTELTAVFTEKAYIEDYNSDNWFTTVDNITPSAYVVDNSRMRLTFQGKSFKESPILINNVVETDGSYTILVRVNNKTPLNSTANGAKIVFNYTDNKNYYYVYIGGNGQGIKLCKMYKGVNYLIRSYERGYIAENGTEFTQLPIDIQLDYNIDGYISLTGYKNNTKLVFFDKVRDRSLKKGKFGFGSANHGFLYFENISLIGEDNDEK